MTHPHERKVTFDNHLSRDEAWEAGARWQLPEGHEVTFSELKRIRSTKRWRHSIWYAPKAVTADDSQSGTA